MAIDYSTIKFLNCTVLDFNATFGNAGTPSSVNVTLVEDRAAGDSYFSPGEGRPVFFSFASSETAWYFNGLLQSEEKSNSTSGNPIYSVVIIDPREILESSELILGNYNGPVNGVPNLLNPFGYIENTDGFGESEIKDGGIKWKKVISALRDMQNEDSDYGGKLQYRGVRYTVDLSQLPQLPSDYRIGGDSIGYLQMINQLCQDAGYDVSYSLSTENVIQIDTISRLSEPSLGSINNFIASTPGAVSKRIGKESRHDVTSKFIVGANQVRLYGQTQQNEDDEEFIDDTIWPYWGHDSDGNLIIGEGNGDEHQIRLDVRHLDVPGLGESYTTDIREIKSLITQSSWESFLEAQNGYQYIEVPISFDYETNTPIPHGEMIDYFYVWNAALGREDRVEEPGYILAKTNDEQLIKDGRQPIHVSAFLATNNGSRYKNYYHNNEPNIHFMKAARLGLPGSFDFNSLGGGIDVDSFDELISTIPLQFSPFSKTQLKFASYQPDDFSSESRKKELYDFLANYAHEYYAKKFMIRIPFVYTYIDREESNLSGTNIPTIDNIANGIGNIKSSLEPTDAAFLDDSELEDSLESNLIPYDIGKFQTEEGLIEGYVRFDDVETLDLSGISDEDMALGQVINDKQSVFIKCQILPNLVYLDRETGFSPRVVIDLPAQVFSNNNLSLRNYTTDKNDNNRVLVQQKIEKLLTAIIVSQEAENPAAYQQYFTDDGAAGNFEILVNTILSRPGADIINEEQYGSLAFPNFAAVPLKSNVDVYGPFYAVGADSKVDFEYNESINPWSYGGYTYMNQAGNAMVNQAITNQTWSESGSIEFPDIPGVALGGKLIVGGPLVTDIRVNVGAGGITTTYTMNSWTKRSGSASQQLLNDLKKHGKYHQAAKRRFKKLLKSPPPKGDKYYTKRERAFTKRQDSKSSHFVLTGQKSGYNTTVLSQPNYHAYTQVDNEYYDKAIVSMDTIFAPVSTNPLYSGQLGKFSQFESGVNPPSPNAMNLNPFPPITGVISHWQDIYPTSIYPKKGFSNSIISAGTSIPEGGLNNRESLYTSGDYRVMALKTPMILHGWGYNTDGAPVPAYSGDPRKFSPDYLFEESGWKTGPLDVRWDNERKVWSASSSTKMGHLVRHSGIPYPDRPDNFSPSGVISDRTFHVYELSPQPPTQNGVFIEVSGQMIPISGAYITEVGIGYNYDSDGNKISYVCKNFDPNLVIPSGEQDDGDILVITHAINGYHVPIYVGCEF